MAEGFREGDSRVDAVDWPEDDDPTSSLERDVDVDGEGSDCRCVGELGGANGEGQRVRDCKREREGLGSIGGGGRGRGE